VTAAPTRDWQLPQGQAAVAPPERRGVARDEVRLLVSDRRGIRHDIFRRLPRYLAPGDIVVVNTSATRAGAIDGTWRRRRVVLHLSSRLDDGDWVVEIRGPDGAGPIREAMAGELLQLEGGGEAHLLSPYLPGNTRLWRARLRIPGAVDRHLTSHGRPIAYGPLPDGWDLSDYQTIFARPDDPTGSSAEMPSAARPFTHAMVTELVMRGITVMPITLHAGVSSLERHEALPPERFIVPARTAEAVTAVRERGGRVVAIGTTVTRALETVARADGRLRPGDGWTDLLLRPGRPARVVTGLVTGWHSPDASHLLLLEAMAGAALLTAAYEAAFEEGYLWHEFGDSCLLLP
jgi:S-adenosylmethionine:tRNA ribosyltransferase-isomerase